MKTRVLAMRRPPKMFVTLAGVQSTPRVMRGLPVVRPVLREVPLHERHLDGIDNQGFAHTLSGGPFGGVLGDETTLTPPQADISPVIDRIEAATKAINDKIDAQDRNRKISLVIAGASALFAAVKLGIIAFPHIKAKVRGES